MELTVSQLGEFSCDTNLAETLMSAPQGFILQEQNDEGERGKRK